MAGYDLNNPFDTFTLDPSGYSTVITPTTSNIPNITPPSTPVMSKGIDFSVPDLSSLALVPPTTPHAQLSGMLIPIAIGGSVALVGLILLSKR